MDDLYSSNATLDHNVYRNIVFYNATENLFDDLIPKNALKKGTQIALDAEARVKTDPTVTPQDMHYTAAISYPFMPHAYQSTRYSSGAYGVWYGSLEHLTTIYETVYHMFRSTLAIEGVQEIVYGKRAIYTVHSKAVLIDLRGKEKQHPHLIANDYTFTQNIGATLQKQGHPGLIAPSARTEGSNVIIFNPDVLSRPALAGNLLYALDPIQKITTVKNPLGKPLMHIPLSYFE